MRILSEEKSASRWLNRRPRRIPVKVTSCTGLSGKSAGHHRVAAAIKAGITHAEVFVKDNMSDAEAVLVYATENATQDGNRASAMAGAVASATWLLARMAARDTVREISLTLGWTNQQSAELKKNFESVDGIGYRPILRVLGGVLKEQTIKDFFANVKSCGEYAKIIADVRKEIDDELAEELRKAEAAERERQRAEAKARALYPTTIHVKPAATTKTANTSIKKCMTRPLQRMRERSPLQVLNV